MCTSFFCSSVKHQTLSRNLFQNLQKNVEYLFLRFPSPKFGNFAFLISSRAVSATFEAHVTPPRHAHRACKSRPHGGSSMISFPVCAISACLDFPPSPGLLLPFVSSSPLVFSPARLLTSPGNRLLFQQLLHVGAAVHANPLPRLMALFEAQIFI